MLADLYLFVSVSFATDLDDLFKISCGKCVMSKCSVVRARYIILFLLYTAKALTSFSYSTIGWVDSDPVIA